MDEDGGEGSSDFSPEFTTLVVYCLPCTASLCAAAAADDMDEDGGEGGSEDDDDGSEEEYSDDEDMSWKVRR